MFVKLIEDFLSNWLAKTIKANCSMSTSKEIRFRPQQFRLSLSLKHSIGEV